MPADDVRNRTSDILGPFVGHVVHYTSVALLVTVSERRGRGSTDGERDHLQLGEGTAHTIRIHQRDASTGSGGNRQHGIDASGFHRHSGVYLLAGILFDQVEQTIEVVFATAFFRHYGRRAHHGAWGNERIIWDLVRLNQCYRTAFLDGLHGHQTANIRVSSSACSQQRSTQGYIVDFIDTDGSHHIPFLLLTCSTAHARPAAADTARYASTERICSYGM